MKKKLYYIIYSIVGIIDYILLMIGAEKIATTQLEMFTKISAEFSKFLDVNKLVSSIRLCSVISIICMIIFLIIAIKNKIADNKGLAFTLAIIPIALLGDTIGIILGVITLIVVSKEKGKSKEKKKLKKLEQIKVTSKDIIMSVILIFAYFGALFIAGYFSNKSYGIYIDIFSKLIILFLVFLTFKNRYKRDIKEFKDNFSSYIGFVFKWWGIMLLLSLVAVIIKLIFSAQLIPNNQQELNKMNLLYLIPMAVIWAPIVEEAIFRGCLKRFIKNDKAFIIVSTIVFGLLHTIFAETSLAAILIQSLQYMAMGFALSYSYAKTNNICVDTSIHFIQNFMAIMVTAIMF